MGLVFTIRGPAQCGISLGLAAVNQEQEEQEEQEKHKNTENLEREHPKSRKL